MRAHEFESTPNDPSLNEKVMDKLLGLVGIKRKFKEFKPLVDVLQADCKQILQVYKSTGKVLYRGAKNKQDYFVAEPRDNRIPMTTSKISQRLYDLASQRAGIEALRSNSFFTSSSYEQATRYGFPYVVFPMDGFKFSWTPGKPDVVVGLNDIANKDNIQRFTDSINEFAKKQNIDLKFDDLYWDLLHQGYARVIHYLESIGYPGVHEITLDSLVDMDKFRNFNTTNENLAGAINEGGEVLILGRCYFLSVEKHGPMLNYMLGLTVHELEVND